MPGAVFLEGESVTLRTVEEEDVEFMRDTINHPEVRRGLRTNRPINGTQEREFFEEQISSDEGGVTFLVAAEEEAVGVIGLNNIDAENGTAEVGLWLHPDFHGEGYGTEASRLVTAHAFEEFRMHRVVARVLAFNTGSQRIWEKLGFEREGVHRDEAFTDGEYVDVHYYSVLEDEWQD